jgi:hypothetical protein
MVHKRKQSEGKTTHETYHNAPSLYSLLGSISRPFSSIFLTKSKVDRTDAAVSRIVEWARCLPAQTLPGQYGGDVRRCDMDEWKE